METEYVNPNEVPEAHNNGSDMIIEENNNQQENTQIQATKEINEPDTIEEEYDTHDYRNPQVMSNVMKFYYEYLFPFELLEKWLRYGNDPKSKRPEVDKEFFAKREISFTLENDAYLRNQYSIDWQELKTKVVKYRPSKIDIGAVFKASPRSTSMTFNDEENLMQVPDQREFVIDIDMDDYNNIRTCCSDANICELCWKFMREANYVIEKALKEDFGFNHIIWLFSGRRGIHAWVCDRRAREMSNEARGSVSEYLRLVAGNDKSGIKIENLKYKSYPHVKRSYERLKKKFIEIVVEDQGIFRNPEKVQQVIEFLKERLSVGDDMIGTIRKALNNPSADLLKKIEDEVVRITGTRKNHIIEELVFYYMYPRIDINVSKGMNHLLKSPFCVHPKSKKLSIPVLNIQTFNPNDVPRIEDLVTIREDGQLIAHREPLQPYVDYFAKFIDEIEEESKKLQRDERMEQRQENERDLEF